MIPWSPTLMKSAPGRTGIAPVHLLDVQDVNGNVYYWATRKITAPSVIVATGGSASNPYAPWIVGAPQLSFHRSMQVSSGNLQMQNLSGDSLQSDFHKIVRRSTLEGALAVLRRWNAAAGEAEREFHCETHFDDSNPTIATLQLRQLNNPSADVAPRYQLGEFCQWRWSSAQCGSTASTPCQQTYVTCQVIERIFVILNNYEKNYGETTANVSGNLQNRVRAF